MTSYRVPLQSLSRGSDLMKTLISRLYACYQEFHSRDRILVDHVAARALPEILKDFPQLDFCPSSQRVSQLTSVIRSRCFDQMVMDFLAKYPDAVVVNLGSRLCTRYWRMPTPHSHWYEVDTAEVMALRQRYFTIVAREYDIEYDCLDFEWMEAIERQDNQPLLLILEGVCMYLEPEENQALFEAIAQNFGHVHLLFDGVSPRFVESPQASSGLGLGQSEDFLGEWQSAFRWGMSSLGDLQSWQIQPRLIQCWDYLLNMAAYPDRLDPWMKNFWPILEPLLRESGQLYHITIEG